MQNLLDQLPKSINMFLNNGNFGLKWSEFKDKETKTKLPKLN